MDFSVVTFEERRIIRTPNQNKDVDAFCRRHLDDMFSKCKEHYEGIFGEEYNETTLLPCPYGLVTSAPIGTGDNRRVLSGMLVENMATASVPAAVSKAAFTNEKSALRIVKLVGDVIADTQEYDSAILEAAIHDVRHLNHSLTMHAEKLLGNFGFAPNSDWDLSLVERDDNLRRALTIFIASRELSEALSMHELARSPSTALQTKEFVPVHKVFYAQKKISYERLEKKSVRVNLGATTKTLSLTRSFRLIPKILLDNAIKYAERNTDIDVRFLDVRGFFRIECTNYGHLVAEDSLEKVFRRGFRGGNRSGVEGHGLGLWLAKLIVEANSGTIKMETVPQKRDHAGRSLGITKLVIDLLDSSIPT